LVKSILGKFAWAVVLSGFLAACAAAPANPPANQADDLVQGGSFAAEGMISIPLRLPADKR
jgi:hypothetical protein